MNPRTTKKGFIHNGMIDANTHTFPDLIRMLQTCKGEIKQDVEDTIINNFSELYQEMNTKGHIEEEVYNRLRFPKDTNYVGEIVAKPDGISQEMRHRANVLR